MRRLILIAISLWLIACGPQPDRCSVDPNLPDCQAARAVAQATIAAIEVDRARLRSQLELSTTALTGQAEVARRQVESDLAPFAALGGAALLAVLAVSITLTTKRTTERLGQALAERAENLAEIVYYGPNNGRLGLLERHADGTRTFKSLDQALAALDYWLPRLNVPDHDKLQAIADYSKRSAVIEGVGLSGQWPLIDDGDDQAPLPQLAVAPAPYPYSIVTQSATAQPLAGWLDEVELKLLASAAPTGGRT